MKTKKLISILVLILIITIAWGTYYISLDKFRLSDTNSSYLADMTWSRSLDKSLVVAQHENKPVLMYFWAIWCQYCAKFQSDTLGNPEVKAILEKDYVLVAMDLDVDRDVSSKYGVSYPPYVIFLDDKGTILQRVPGAVDANYLLPIVKDVRDKVRSK